jgi:hypothetical protein
MAELTGSRFPADMERAAHRGDASTLEDVANDALDRVKCYARENPTSFALCALGIGFVLGWRLKPW